MSYLQTIEPKLQNSLLMQDLQNLHMCCFKTDVDSLASEIVENTMANQLLSRPKCVRTNIQKKRRRNYHHEIGMFSKLPKFLVKLQMYCTCAIITCDWYIFYPIFHCGLYCRAVSVQTIYVLNKEIFQILVLKSTVCNRERFQIKSGL